MISLKILLASKKLDDSAEMSRVIDRKFDGHIPGIEIYLEVVSTLAAVRERAQSANAIMLHLHLDDAGPDEVIAAIPDLPQPVMVMTDDTDGDLHAKCKTAGATVLVTGEANQLDVCSSILHCLGRWALNEKKTLPAD